MQPRSSIYAMIDQICLMANGNCVYFGPAGDHVQEHFAKLGYPVPKDFNPADHLLDVISVDMKNEKAEARSRERVATLIKSAPAGAPPVAAAEPASTPVTADTAQRASAGFGTAFWLLLCRTWREQTRNKKALCFKFGMNMFFQVHKQHQACK